MSITIYAKMAADAEDRMKAARMAIAVEYRDWERKGGNVLELKRAVKGMRITKAKTRHGEAKAGSISPEYRAWRSMVSRCMSVTNVAWKDYGGRGITVCQRWLKYENFLADMGRRPSPQHSLDRMKNDQGYSPDNCRWASKKVQARNRRSSTSIEWKGETRTIAEWAEITGLTVSAITQRLRADWPIELVMTASQRPHGRKTS